VQTQLKRSSAARAAPSSDTVAAAAAAARVLIGRRFRAIRRFARVSFVPFGPRRQSVVGAREHGATTTTAAAAGGPPPYAVPRDGVSDP